MQFVEGRREKMNDKACGQIWGICEPFLEGYMDTAFGVSHCHTAGDFPPPLALPALWKEATELL